MDSKPQELQSVPPQYISAYPVDDEISLVDIWITLARFRHWFFVSFLLFAVPGLLFAGLWLEEKYQMSSVISPGIITLDNGREPIESPASVVAEINRSILPELTKSYAGSHGLGLFNTSVSNPRGTNLIIIENKVTEESRAAIEDFQRKIVSQIVENHKKLFDALNVSLKRQIAQESKQLSELTNPLKLSKLTESQRLSLQIENQALAKLMDSKVQESNLQAIRDKIKINDDSIRALSQQNDALLEQASLNGNGAPSKDKGDVRINIAENRLAINDLRNLNIGLKQDLERFDTELAQEIENKKTQIQAIETSIKLIEDDLNDQISLQRKKISGLELRLENDVTRAAATAELSLRPVGLTRVKAIVPVVVLSVFFAFVITVAVIFREKVKEKVAAGS